MTTCKASFHIMIILLIYSVTIGAVVAVIAW